MFIREMTDAPAPETGGGGAGFGGSKDYDGDKGKGPGDGDPSNFERLVAVAALAAAGVVMTAALVLQARNLSKLPRPNITGQP